ncbi:MAG TPA: Crp/Fnr family transcriptional regulator [Novosphingobium sp.]
MNACMDCAVRDKAICNSLAEDQLAELNRIGRHQVVKRGQALVWQGDESLLVGNVLEGALKLSVSSADGRDQTLGVVLPSDFIGRPFGATSMHSVIALTDARVCTFSRSAFDTFAQEHPSLEHGLLERTLTDLDRARQWMMMLARKSAGERVAIFLLHIAKRHETYGEEPLRFELPLSRQDMADLLGLTIETVSRQITRLREEGIIETPSRRAIIVLDQDALEACTGEA